MPRFVAIPAFGHFGPPVGVNFGQHEKQPSPQSQSVGTSSDCSSDGTRPATAFSPAMTAASFAPLSFQSDGSPSPNPTAHVMLLVQHPPSSRSVSGASVQQAPHQQAPHCAQTNSNLTRARKVSSSSSSSSRRRKSSSDNLECHHDSEDSPGSRSAIVKCSEKKEKLPVLPKEVDMKWYADTSRAQPITWSKGGPMTFPPETPCIELLTEEEVTLCRTLRLFPIQYLKIKETVIAATYTRAPFRKKEVRMWFPIDVNKINKLYDW
ncbi:hypothetical protein DFJ73DRAFT_492649 [Zopfochytrium polystomum]|nr:hypothetical protein DFJ73DRAFT_492649 [Zopfochytrium polystomum]